MSIELVLIFLFGISYLMQLFCLWKYIFPLFYSHDLSSENIKPVSVIIVCKNELEQLKENLPSILNQDFPDFEVIIMDDHSSDGSFEWLCQITSEHKNLVLVKASSSIEEKAGKKWALKEAIEVAKHDRLLFTDADCKPVSNQWITTMTINMTAKSIRLGLSPYMENRGLLNKLVQYETQFTAMNYLGMANAGHAYMGVGRNIAYTRAIAERAHQRYLDVASGDDDLGIQDVLRDANVEVVKDSLAHTFSQPKGNWIEWVKQKSRHYSTAWFYPRDVQLRLLMIKASIYLPNIIFILLMFIPEVRLYAIYLFVLRNIMYAIFWEKVRRGLTFPTRIYFLPWIELFFMNFDLWQMLKKRESKKVDLQTNSQKKPSTIIDW